jgi:N,N'-diacetyllegionaminate synthase
MDFASDWIIAEIGSVHDGSFGNAQKLIEAAARAGANCVKFQTHVAHAETLADAPSPSYFQAEPRLQYFQRTGFSLEQWRALAATAKAAGVTFLSSPFALEAVDLLEEVGVEAYKIPSGEVTNLPLLRRVASTGKPVLLSSGMSTWTELAAAVAVLQSVAPLCVMQCTSAYPCPPEQVGLNNLDEIRVRFPGAALGYSDHTLGVAASIAAAALGAVVIEKHFTFSRLMYGSDAKNSMEPVEFQGFCAALRETWAMRRSPVDKDQLAREQLSGMKRIFQKSVVAARPISGGTVIAEVDLAFKKPGDGISAARSQELVGKRLKGPVPADHKFSWEDFE